MEAEEGVGFGGQTLQGMRTERIVRGVHAVPMVAVETPLFLRKAVKILSDEERAELVRTVAAAPEAGEIIPDTGGVRKVRWALPGRGKSGGARVIYYFHSERMPVVLLSIYAKNAKVNLSAADCNELKALVPVLVAELWKGRLR